jgi:outer membrane putative beta-barrel porin/alpha-amylase
VRRTPSTVAGAAFLGVVGAVLLVMVCGPASPGRAAEQDRVDPDRPDVTNSATTVPPGAVQIESGLAWERTSRAGERAEHSFSAETAARVGIAERFEIAIGLEPIVHVWNDAADTGVGDLTLAVKYRMFDPPEGTSWPSLALRPVVKVPTASAPIGTEKVDAGLVGLASFDLPAGLGLDVNAGVLALGQSQPSGYLVQARASASLSARIAEDVAPFVEVFYGSREEREGRDTVGFDTGVIYWATRRVAFDAAVQTSLVGPLPDWAVRVGVSVRFGR